MSAAPCFKLVLAGSGGVGKTAWVARYRTGEFRKSYHATSGVERNTIAIHTNHGQQAMDVWDTAGQERFSDKASGYYAGANAAIVMFDLTSRVSFRDAQAYVRELRAALGSEVPIVLCGNKCDCKDPAVRPKDIISYLKRAGVHYYAVSAKSMYNMEKPFLHLLRTLQKDSTLSIVDAPAVQPPEVVVTAEQVARWQQAEADTTVKLKLQDAEWARMYSHAQQQISPVEQGVGFSTKQFSIMAAPVSAEGRSILAHAQRVIDAAHPPSNGLECASPLAQTATEEHTELLAFEAAWQTAATSDVKDDDDDDDDGAYQVSSDDSCALDALDTMQFQSAIHGSTANALARVSSLMGHLTGVPAKLGCGTSI